MRGARKAFACVCEKGIPENCGMIGMCACGVNCFLGGCAVC